LTGRSCTPPTALHNTGEKKRGSCGLCVESLPLDGRHNGQHRRILNKKMWGNLRNESAQDSLSPYTYTQDAGGLASIRCVPFQITCWVGGVGVYS
jgi:hypothetical protein